MRYVTRWRHAGREERVVVNEAMRIEIPQAVASASASAYGTRWYSAMSDLVPTSSTGTFACGGPGGGRRGRGGRHGTGGKGGKGRGGKGRGGTGGRGGRALRITVCPPEHTSPCRAWRAVPHRGAPY